MMYLFDTCVAIAYWTILSPLLPDKDQSSIIFGSEKDQYHKYNKYNIINIDKEPQFIDL